jgi:hypothetical protein
MSEFAVRVSRGASHIGEPAKGYDTRLVAVSSILLLRLQREVWIHPASKSNASALLEHQIAICAYEPC